MTINTGSYCTTESRITQTAIRLSVDHLDATQFKTVESFPMTFVASFDTFFCNSPQTGIFQRQSPSYLHTYQGF